MGDIHCSAKNVEALRPLFGAFRQHADILVLCGDLTEYGLADEAHLLVRELSVVQLPVVAVLGNHDFESGQADQVRGILTAGGVMMLDGEVCEIYGVGFAGVKGFGGGFGRHTLGAWGEDAIKRFVQEALDEAMKLERALSRLTEPNRIAVLHYSPIAATVYGEPPEVTPFLGSSRLEEPLNRFPVSAVFHGHAHYGSPEGRTERGSPVYNVALPVLARHFPGQPPFRVLHLPVQAMAPS